MLCQIGACWKYSKKWNRVLLVDTNHPKTRYFRDRFSNYFVTLNPDLILDISILSARLADLPVIPAQLSGRVHDYVAVAGKTGHSMVDEATGIDLTFDFSRDHDVPLLVHHTWGRTLHPLEALAQMRLHPAIRHEVRARLDQIGGEFTALHVRATDYQSDYRQGISELRSKLTGRVFLGTDNPEVLDFARAECPDAEIYSFSRLPEDGKPLHDLGDRTDDSYEANRDAIVDVILLAHSKTLFALRLQENRLGAALSGYSLLALSLKKHPALLGQLMSSERLDHIAPG